MEAVVEKNKSKQHKFISLWVVIVQAMAPDIIGVFFIEEHTNYLHSWAIAPLFPFMSSSLHTASAALKKALMQRDQRSMMGSVTCKGVVVIQT